MIRCHVNFNSGMPRGLINVDHLKVTHTKVNPYWITKLEKLEKLDRNLSVIQNLIRQLTPENELGFVQASGKTIANQGTLVEFATNEKAFHKDRVILLRSGEFYETFGIDSIMMIAYCGLNPMGGRCKGM